MWSQPHVPAPSTHPTLATSHPSPAPWGRGVPTTGIVPRFRGEASAGLEATQGCSARYPGTQVSKRATGSRWSHPPGLMDSLPRKDGHGWRRAKMASRKGRAQNRGSPLLGGRALCPKDSTLRTRRRGEAGRLLVMPKYIPSLTAPLGKSKALGKQQLSRHTYDGWWGPHTHLTFFCASYTLLWALTAQGAPIMGRRETASRRGGEIILLNWRL